MPMPRIRNIDMRNFARFATFVYNIREESNIQYCPRHPEICKSSRRALHPLPPQQEVLENPCHILNSRVSANPLRVGGNVEMACTFFKLQISTPLSLQQHL